MLTIVQIEQLIRCIRENFEVAGTAEITLECNPDDLNISYLQELKTLGINRISIGIQSFDDQILKFINRRHNSLQAENAINLAKEINFTDISIDLMYGIPSMSREVYESSLQKGISYNVTHISAYHLNIEPNTVFYKKWQNREFEAINEEESLFQFDLTIEKLKEYGYTQYEISNYAVGGHESRHNLLYWNNGKYLGIGPSAHSYDGDSRQWNISNTASYIKYIKENQLFFEKEILSETDHYNEYILTGLRTNTGVSEKYVNENFRESIGFHFRKNLQGFINEAYIKDLGHQNFALEKKGIFILDYIIKRLYYN